MFRQLLTLLFIVFSFSAFAQDISQELDTSPKVTATLYATQDAIVPGQDFTLLIEHQIIPEWHTYWRNTGDSGAAPRFNFTLPEGLSQEGGISYPMPEAIPYGPLVNFGHKGQIFYAANFKADKTLSLNQDVTITASLEWLVCKEICIPETANLSITLPVAEQASPINQDLLNKAQTAFPQKRAFETASFKDENNIFSVSFSGVNTANTAYFFPYEWGVIKNLETQQFTTNDNGITLNIPRDTRDITALKELEGVLVVDGNAYEATVTRNQDTPIAETTPLDIVDDMMPKTTDIIGVDFSTFSFSTILLFAFIGGVILNLMPCVFPILSMKALSLVQHSHSTRLQSIGLGLSYTFGVILSFLAIAGALIALQLSGAQIGWGFQLQNPIIVILLAALLFIIGLNLSGFFEIGNNLGGVGHSFTTKQGYTGSFFTGVLATLVATPCTAPFMATALGFALTQPPVLSLSIFAMLGFGLSFPYLLLTIIPALSHLLPKPGTWMVKFKEFLAFPMYLSAIWLGWVFIQQAPAFSFIHLVIGAVLLTFIIWMIKAWPKTLVLRIISAVVLIALITCAAGFAFMQETPKTPQQQLEQKNSYVDFTTLNLANALMGERPVLVNMTADWCITCKVNERLALSTTAVQQRIKDTGIIYIKGDWTNQNPEITAYLKGFGRNGVPLYVYYGAAKNGARPEAVVLPQLLTEKTLLETFQ